MNTFVLSTATILAIIEASHTRLVDPPPMPLVFAVIMVESSGRPDAVNEGSGCVGLMQLSSIGLRDIEERLAKPGELPPFATEPRRKDPLFNVTGGSIYLRWLIKRWPDDLDRALVGYNWGPGNARKWDGDHGSLPRETATYIQRVRSWMDVYEEKKRGESDV